MTELIIDPKLISSSVQALTGAHEGQRGRVVWVHAVSGEMRFGVLFNDHKVEQFVHFQLLWL